MSEPARPSDPRPPPPRQGFGVAPGAPPWSGNRPPIPTVGQANNFGLSKAELGAPAGRRYLISPRAVGVIMIIVGFLVALPMFWAGIVGWLVGFPFAIFVMIKGISRAIDG